MTAQTENATPAEAEADVEHARAGLVGTLNQLRENLKPSNMANEVMSNAKVSASAVTDQVWDVARKNPIPALLIGAGAAMILGLGTKAASGGKPVPPRHDAPVTPLSGQGRTVSVGGAGQAPVLASQSAGDMLDRANRHVRSLASQATETLKASARDATTKGEDTMSNYTRTRDHISGSRSRLIEEQPLILAAFGLAVGAAIGAAIPQTDAENSLVGEHAHALRDSAQGAVAGQLETLKAAASHAVDDIKKSAADHGVSTDNLGGLARDVASHAQSAAYEAGRGLDPTK